MITKNRQTDATITKMAKAAFPDKQVFRIMELPEGMCNAAYYVVFSDGSESILKIAAENGTGYLSNEINLMKAEVAAMNLVRSHSDVKAAAVQAYDTSRTLCSGDYFFMEKLPGTNYHFLRSKMTEAENAAIDCELGQIARSLQGIRNPQFGFLGDSRRFDTLYAFVRVMLVNLLHDAAARQIDIIHSGDDYLSWLEQDRSAFDEVRIASLVHWDMWEGNVFVQDGHITGIIDWERSMWGEPYMDDRFRRHNIRESFLAGYGIRSFTENEKRRLRWYDVILYLTMMIEVFYREYEDKGNYYWTRDLLAQVLAESGLA